MANRLYSEMREDLSSLDLPPALKPFFESGETKTPTGNVTALYCRLSRDDGEEEAGSIIHQKEILTHFAEESGFSNFQIYQDQNFSGTTFERPAFLKMLKDIEDGKISTVIVKDLSRLGRAYLGVGMFTDVYFPSRGVRFIAMADHYDSAVKDSASKLAPIKSMRNQWMADDISRKIRARITEKKAAGVSTSNVPPFGYIWDPDHHARYIIDEEAGATVQEIYRLYLSGMSMSDIAVTLTQEKRKTATALAIERGHHRRAEHPEVWNPTSIKHILDNPVYLGIIVNNQSHKAPHNNHEVIMNNVKDWQFNRDMHEPLITEEDWKKVRELRGEPKKRQKRTHVHDDNPIAYKVFCGDCGSPMRRKKRKTQADYFYCLNYKGRKELSTCGMHYTVVDDLTKMVFQDIKAIIEDSLSDKDAFLETFKDIDEEAKLKLKQCKKRLEMATGLLKNLHKNQPAFDREEYLRLDRKYNTLRSRLIRRVNELEHFVAGDKDPENDPEFFLEQAEKYRDAEALTEEMVTAFIKGIYIYEEERPLEEIEADMVKLQESRKWGNVARTTKRVKILYNCLDAFNYFDDDKMDALEEEYKLKMRKAS